jgi:hypothetical protein
MFLVQMLLPNVTDRPGDPDHFIAVRRELTDRFGGVTAYVRSPAAGLWKNDRGAVEADSVVMVEVEVEVLDLPWWQSYRTQLERAFREDTILIRAIRIDRL